MMLLILLPLFPLISANLVIDVSQRTVSRYLQSMGPFLKEEALIGTVIPDQDYSRLFCAVFLQNTTINSANSTDFNAFLDDNDGYFHLKLSNLTLSLSGNHTRSFLFFHSTTNWFTSSIHVDSITIGPLIPMSASRLPFIYLNLTCTLKSVAFREPSTSGWFASSLIRQAIENSFGSILCDSMVQSLDNRLREDLLALELNFPVLNEHSHIDYRLARAPLFTESFIRYHFRGRTEGSEANVAANAAEVNQTRDITMHVNEMLLNELAHEMCRLGYFDTNVTEVHAFTCQLTNIRITNPLIWLDVISIDKMNGQMEQKTRSYTVYALQNKHLEIMLRLKSQVADSESSVGDEHIFNHLAATFKQFYRLPLPSVIGARFVDVVFDIRQKFIAVQFNFD